jgi:hypothetical protein
MKLRPSASMMVMRALPYSMYAHSASLCQCISRMAPALRRMSTPAMLVEMGNSRTVISRVQPPRSKRMCASANEKRRFGRMPASRAGGTKRSGFYTSTVTLRGPGSVPPRRGRSG